MAGIGFELRKILSKDSYGSLLRAYGYSAIIGSGPWIISIVSIVIVSYLLAGAFGSAEVQLFTASITHVYAFSLILVGPLQLVLTRFAADKLSVHKPEAIFPSFLAALTVAGVVGGVGGLLFFGFGTHASLLYQLSAAGLMVYVCCIFIASNYLTALLDYREVVWAFFVGYLLSGVAAYALGITWGVPAAMFGFTAGHAVLFLLLFKALKRGLGSGAGLSWEVLAYFKRFPESAAVRVDVQPRDLGGQVAVLVVLGSARAGQWLDLLGPPLRRRDLPKPAFDRSWDGGVLPQDRDGFRRAFSGLLRPG